MTLWIFYVDKVPYILTSNSTREWKKNLFVWSILMCVETISYDNIKVNTTILTVKHSWEKPFHGRDKLLCIYGEGLQVFFLSLVESYSISNIASNYLITVPISLDGNCINLIDWLTSWISDNTSKDRLNS